MSTVRKWLKILHRDIGYLAAGLTVIYAISGVAVNHVADWNPNYSIEKSTTSITPPEHKEYDPELTTAHVLREIGEDAIVKSTFRPDPNTLQIFAEGNTISVNLQDWTVNQEKVKSRTVIRETNFLHLNAPKKVWTYVADLYAVALAFLAISGLFMIKGKKGITGRGAWLTLAGIIIPLFFLFLYYYK
jgi:uncharacterized protein